MTNSTIKNKIADILTKFFVTVFWLIVWQLLSMAIGNDFLLPSPHSTAKELLDILADISSYKVIFFTLLRVIVGLLFGIILGVVLGIICHKFSLARILVAPLISVIKSTPVASFIILLWVIMSGDALSIVVAILMVTPIVHQNIFSAYDSIDKNLSEVCDVFAFSEGKRFRLLILPALTAYLIPAIVTSSGLAWKAEIAAEIIAYTKNSIGQNINDAKYILNTPRVFAWTVIVIIFSIILEKLTKIIAGRIKNVDCDQVSVKSI